MSQLKATPGPWLIHAERRWVVPAGDAFAEPMEALPICQLRDPDERLSEDETLANGFIIAAAPELYEALECLLGRFCELDAECGNDSGKQSEVIIAKDALRKARGEA